ncbi:hypothetical protein ACWCQL_28550 [Streptomyces sp. NPDC002073]
MTDTITEPVAPVHDTATPPPPTPPAPADAPATVRQEHTPGGWPVVPLAFSGANTATGLLATAAIAGGPIVAAVAVTGAVLLSAASIHKTRKTTKTGGKGSNRGGNAPVVGRIPAQPRTTRQTGRKAPASRHRSSGAGRHAAGPGTTSRAGSSAARRKSAAGAGGGRIAQAAGRLGGGRVGRVQQLRAAARTQAPTRAAARTQAVQVRRQVTDARRTANAQARTARTAGAGPVRRAAAHTVGKAAAARNSVAGRARAGRDQRAAKTVSAGRARLAQAAHRKRVAQLAAPARKTARQALRRSAARFHARRAAAGVLGGLLGTVGMLTTPLGRKLGWAWLQYPGRRLYRWLAGRAEVEREDRDAAIEAQLDEDLEAAEAQAAAEADEDEQQIGDQAARPASRVPAGPTSTITGGVMATSSSGFRFEEVAAEMEQAAQSYEPENAMEILAMIEGLPQALASIANIMQILAERSDSEFPMEKDVAGGFNDIYGALNSAVAVADDLGPLFRQVHAQDIARHEDPRNGTEAEKGWNV